MPTIGHQLYGPLVPYAYFDNDTASASIGVDGTDSNLLKISASPTMDVNPTTAAQITIDPDTNGDITLIPNGTGTVNIDYMTQYFLPIIGASGAVQDLADGLGSANTFLMSNGAGAEPTWETSASMLFPITALDNTDSTYVVLSTDVYLSCDVSAGILDIDLPNSTTTGRVIRIKDSGGDAATNNITLSTPGGVVTIDGATSYAMNTAYQAVSVIWNGASYEIF